MIPLLEQNHQPQRPVPLGQLLEPVIVQQKQLLGALQHVELDEHWLQCVAITPNADSGRTRYRIGATASAEAPIAKRTSRPRRDVRVSSADTAAFISLSSPGIVHPLI